VDSQREIILRSLVLEATARHDALTSKEALSLNRLEWIHSVRHRLLQVFGEGDIVSGFNSPDRAAQIGDFQSLEDAVLFAKSEYQRDIDYFQAIRRSSP
jgi:hypothetical protein